MKSSTAQRGDGFSRSLLGKAAAKFVERVVRPIHTFEDGLRVAARRLLCTWGVLAILFLLGLPVRSLGVDAAAVPEEMPCQLYLLGSELLPEKDHVEAFEHLLRLVQIFPGHGARPPLKNFGGRGPQRPHRGVIEVAPRHALTSDFSTQEPLLWLALHLQRLKDIQQLHSIHLGKGDGGAEGILQQDARGHTWATEIS